MYVGIHNVGPCIMETRDVYY